jgi:hypothetical protein
LKTNFNAGDTLLVRFRLYSNNDSHVGWGWSIDDLYIQQTPTEVESKVDNAAVVYPNPSNGKFKISYSLNHDAEVSLLVWDMTGRQVYVQSAGTQPAGKNEMELNLESMPDGVYLARLKTNDSEHVLKLMVKK